MEDNRKQNPRRLVKQRRFGARSKARFLEELEKAHGIQSQALMAMTGLGRTKRGQPARWSTLKNAQRDDLEFAESCRLIVDQAADRLEAEVVRRALGVAHKLYQGGKAVFDPKTGEHAEVTRYSDGLLLKALAAIRPGKWADRQNVHHSGTVELAVARHWQIRTDDMMHLTQAQQDQLHVIMTTIRDGRKMVTRGQAVIEHHPGEGA